MSMPGCACWGFHLVNRIWARHALTEEGWRDSVLLEIDGTGRIESIETGKPAEGHQCCVLIPAPANLHSHAFQRVMAGLTESRSSAAGDDFWTWRRTMYGLLEHLTPDDVEAISAFAQMEMLEAGFAAVAEFHYLHHAKGGRAYENPCEMSQRVVAAAERTGIGLTLLPVLYEHGNIARSPLEGAQLRFGSNPDDFARLVESIRPEVAGLGPDSLVGAALHSMRTVPLETIAKARELFPDIPLHIHAAEQTAEVEAIADATSLRPVEWLLENCGLDKLVPRPLHTHDPIRNEGSWPKAVRLRDFAR